MMHQEKAKRFPGNIRLQTVPISNHLPVRRENGGRLLNHCNLSIAKVRLSPVLLSKTRVRCFLLLWRIDLVDVCRDVRKLFVSSSLPPLVSFLFLLLLHSTKSRLVCKPKQVIICCVREWELRNSTHKCCVSEKQQQQADKTERVIIHGRNYHHQLMICPHMIELKCW